MSEKKIHQDHFQVGQMPWKIKKEKQMNVRMKFGEVHVNFGWFKGDVPCLFYIKILEFDTGNSDWTVILSIKIFKLVFEITIGE